MQFHICGEFGGKKLRSHLHLVFFEFFTYGKIRKDIVKKHNWLYTCPKNLNTNSSNQTRVEKIHRGSSEEKRYSS